MPRADGQGYRKFARRMLIDGDLDVASELEPFVHADPDRGEVTVDHSGGPQKDDFFSLKVAFDMTLDSNHPGHDIALDPTVAPHRDGVPGKRHRAFEPAVDRQVLASAHVPLEDEGFPDQGMFYRFAGRIGQERGRTTGVRGRGREFPELPSPHGGIERATITTHGSRTL